MSGHDRKQLALAVAIVAAFCFGVWLSRGGAQ